MPRTKVKLAFIENSKARKSSFMKRKESLKIKLHELCILCDVEACFILYSPYEPELELWPDDINVFQNVLNQFQSKPEIERIKNMLNQESYLKERINKVKEQLNKQVMANREILKSKLLSECFSGKISVADLNKTDLEELVSVTALMISNIDEMMELQKGALAAAAAPESQQPQPHEIVGGSSNANNSAAEGTDVEPYVPVMENIGALDDTENTYWYPSEWLSDQEDDGLDLVPWLNNTKSFPKVPWSDTCLAKKD